MKWKHGRPSVLAQMPFDAEFIDLSSTPGVAIPYTSKVSRTCGGREGPIWQSFPISEGAHSLTPKLFLP